MKTAIILFISIFSIFSFGQENKLFELGSDTTIYRNVDTLASYSNGMSSMMIYLVKNIKYPEEMTEFPIQSSFYIQFVVEKNGDITNVKPSNLKRSPTRLDILFVKDNEQVFLNMSKWKPAIFNGEEVRSIYTLPIHVHWK